MTRTLSETDRCDLCHAQAYVHVLLQTGDLLFCNHHYIKYKTALDLIALEIADESYFILSNSTESEDVD